MCEAAGKLSGFPVNSSQDDAPAISAPEKVGRPFDSPNFASVALFVCVCDYWTASETAAAPEEAAKPEGEANGL